VFSSNFFVWKSVSYFDSGVQPLVHTWSLAVEEQYYLFFPVLLLVLHRRRNWMAAALWAVFIGSLVLSVALVAIKPSAAFYLLPSRALEMMLGGCWRCGGSARAGRGRFTCRDIRPLSVAWHLRGTRFGEVVAINKPAGSWLESAT
jgi:peptidoglycan/LPS O-acetylase OafA/YrhL